PFSRCCNCCCAIWSIQSRKGSGAGFCAKRNGSWKSVADSSHFAARTAPNVLPRRDTVPVIAIIFFRSVSHNQHLRETRCAQPLGGYYRSVRMIEVFIVAV